MRIGITLCHDLLEIWPIDNWSRKKAIEILDHYKIGFQYVPTTMGTMAFRFNTKEDFKLALGLLSEQKS
jgi:hypothetical protein